MLLVTKWTFFVLGMMLSVFTGLSSAASKCIGCAEGSEEKDCTKSITCPAGLNWCVKILKNGKFYQRGCNQENTAKAFGLSSGDCATEKYKDLVKKASDFNKGQVRTIEDDDEVKFCMCNSDDCNSGIAPSVSGLMFGSSLAVFFLARRIYGF